MLIELSVTNFKSIREKQTFSMVAAPRLHKKGNVFVPDVEGEKLPALLKVAAIYGPNASGKSNLFDALYLVSMLADVDAPQKIPVSPFRFDHELTNAPSDFEIHFISGRQRYTYEVSCTAERITRECLIAYPKGKEQLLFERNHTETGDEYVFGEALEGGDLLHGAWKNLTGPTASFLRQAVRNSSENLQQLQVPFGWLSDRVLGIRARHLNLWAESTKNVAAKFPAFGEEISGFLQDIDVPVTNITVVNNNVNALSAPLELRNDSAKNSKIALSSEPVPKTKTTLTHKTALGEALFDYSEESTGTQNLMGFFIPWSQRGRVTTVLVVDELDSSLHPEIVALLVEKHIKSEIPSQLIFTTHDTHLMDTKLMRRDQFWITERDRNGATQLRSVHDFEGRDSEDIEKRYFEGRYRGLPIIKRG